jgi:STE24 endopeptidase
MRCLVAGLTLWILFVGGLTPAAAQSTQPPADPAVVGVDAATDAYLATVPADARARSDAYFEGGYWVAAWQFLWSSLVLIALLHTGYSSRFREAAARITRVRWLQPAVYWLAVLVFTSVLEFPLAVYTDFWREHQYGLATQTFAAWMGDQLKAFGIGLLLGSVLVVVLYAVVRRVGRTWWLWGALVTMAFLAMVAAIGPVFLAPVFNRYQPLQDAAIREPILRMAHANGIAANEIWEMDASRQTTRISANVSGMFGTERITLNDNLLKRASPAAIEAVMGHEMGHYVLNHVYEMLSYVAVIVTAGFALSGWAFRRLADRYRSTWRVEGIADPAGLPLIALIFGAYLFLLTPLLNTIVRTNEFEADMFGLNAARQPDGFAEAALLLGDYRKLDPSPLEEMIFFDHPGGRTRIRAAMQWKANQQARPGQ